MIHFFAMWTTDSGPPILNPTLKCAGVRQGLGLLLVGLLLALVLPLRVGAQEVRLSETYTSPNPEETGLFGDSVAQAGDVNGDGTPDILVGAKFESPGGTDSAGRAYLIDGSKNEVLYTLTSPSPKKYGSFGNSVARVGDINDDGTPDLLVGAYLKDRAYLIDGTNGEVLHTLSSPNPEETASGGYFGKSVAGAGDVNGDDTPDLLVGAEYESPGGTDLAGRTYLFDGSSGEVLRDLSSPNPEEGGNFGNSVAGVGDVNGDGAPDLLVGASGEHRAYLFDGSDGEVLHSLTSPFSNSMWVTEIFGDSVAGAGDVNGDGTPDLLVGAPGQAYLIDGIDGEMLDTLTTPNPEVSESFGVSVARAGDVNGDGSPDLLVGAHKESPGDTDSAGRVYLFDGSSGEVLRALSSPNPEKKGRFGSSLAWAENINGDGTPGLLVGADESPGGTDKAGRVYRFKIGDQSK